MEQKLNILLSDLVVEYHKLQNFHWYAKGHNFFTVHIKMEELFTAIADVVDDVAETMLMLEIPPVATMKEFLETAQIKEAPNEPIAGLAIFKHVLADFEYFMQLLTTLKTEADETLNYLVSAMTDELMAQFAKNIWMIKQVLKDEVM